MNTQPAALHYAEVLENFYLGLGRLDATGAAAELRSLHEENERLKAQPQQKPVAIVASHLERVDWLRDEPPDGTLLYTSPPAQRKPLHIGEETAAFKAWFDAWWIGDGEQGETIPTQSDKHFLTYLDQYTLGFGAWMAAKHAARGIKGDA